MPLKLDVKRKLLARSDRVKCVDLHPTEPWMLASLYNGNVHVWNHESQLLVKSFEVCDLPVRAAKFVPRKNWIITGSDDMQIRVFNYNTLERIHIFEAHSDYIRSIVIHPTQPFILTSSDDMLIKLWNWEKQWSCTQVFEGHTHYVMQIVINPKDNNTFASASLDRLVKVWQLGSGAPNFSLEGHEKGVNCVDYYHGGDKPYLISGADDRLVKIWDYQNKTCIQTLEGHGQNISAVTFHPELPIIMTGSEDGTVRIWHANTYRLESTLNYNLDRVWTIACLKGCNSVALGYDEGSIIIKLGREEPAMSMDSSGKIIWAKHSEQFLSTFLTLINRLISANTALYLLGFSSGNLVYASYRCGRTNFIWREINGRLGREEPAMSMDSSGKIIWAKHSEQFLSTFLTLINRLISANTALYLLGFSSGNLVYASYRCGRTNFIWREINGRLGREEPAMSMDSSGKIIWAKHSEQFLSTFLTLINRLISANTALYLLGFSSGNLVYASYRCGRTNFIWREINGRLGREEPAMSMDSSGKIIWAKHSELQQANLKAMTDADIKDGERLPLVVKDMGSCEIYPQTISHNPNGRFVVVCGDGEYIIYTAMALRNKSFGSAQEFVWALDSSEYAVRESSTSVKIFKNFKEKKVFKPEYGTEAIFGGHMLGVKSISGLAFYDWESLDLIRRIEIQPKHVYWSESGELVCIATDDSFYILKYNAEAVTKAKHAQSDASEDGIEEAFDVIGMHAETVKTGLWIGDCFIYTNSVNRLNYYVGGEIVTIAHLDRVMYLLGYIPKDSRLYLGDKELNVVSYSLLLSVLEYQTAVMRGDFDTAHSVLPSIPWEQRTRVAHFLEKQGFKSQALVVSTDPDHKFELALQLGNLKVAYSLAKDAMSELKWKQLAELAMSKCEFQLAEECLHHAKDYGGLLLLATSSGNAGMVEKLAQSAEDCGINNVSFISYFLLNQKEKALNILIQTGRLPEAAFFARTYLPSQVSRIVKLWKESLNKVNEKASLALADPEEYENLFPGLSEAIKAEQYLERNHVRQPANAYVSAPPNYERDIVEEMKQAESCGDFVYIPDASKVMEEEAASELKSLANELQKSFDMSKVELSSHLLPEKTQSKPEVKPFSLNVEDDLDLDIDIQNLVLDETAETEINFDEDLLSED